MGLLTTILKDSSKTASAAINNTIDAVEQYGIAAVHSIVPDDIEYYLCSLELFTENKERVGFISFVVMPSQIVESHTPIQTMIKTNRGISTVFTDSFSPIDISIAGSFGRKFRLILNYTDPNDVLDSNNSFSSLNFGIIKGVNSGVKSGYGLTKLLEHILSRANKTEKNKPLYLVFNNYSFNTSYVTDVINYSFNQNENYNMIWNYSIQLRAVADNRTFFSSESKTNFLKTVSANSIATGLTNMVNEMTRML
jgi:hypothetical protein